MEKATQHIREIVHGYYSRPKGMSEREFCRVHRIRVYQLRRMREMCAQRLMPGLVELTKRNLAIYTYESGECLRDLWKESSRLIAVEVSDSEKAKLRRNGDRMTEFEHSRFRLLIDVAMLPFSEKAGAALRRAHKEVLDAYDF